MNANKKNISSIEDYFFQLLKGIGDVYFGTLPTPEYESEKMILVNCENAINDFGAFGNGVVNIYLYAKPNGEEKNGDALREMEEQINEILEKSQSQNGYSSSILYKDSGYDDEKRLHFIIVAMNLLVV